MRFSLIRATLIALFSVSFTAQSYGELIMIRHPPKIENGKSVQKLTCQSENDGDALVWNGQFKDSTDHGAFEKYFVKSEECVPGCKCELTLNHPANEWKRVHSADRPMNPVFDFRWEEFSDYNGNREHLDNLKRSGTFVFSVRGSKDVVLRFGEDDNTMANHSCFMITLAASDRTMSKISTCVGDQGSDNSKSSSARILVSELEWRTYIVKWNGNGKIELKQPGKDLSHAETIIEKTVNEWANHMQLFVKNPGEQWLRFHFYNYTVTEKKDIYSTSQIISKELAPKNLTVELMVGLCAKCQIEVSVIDKNKTAELDRKTINSTDDPSVWQHKILNLSWNASLQDVRVKLKTVTDVTRNDSKIWWAIAFSLYYQSDVATRESTRKIILSPNMPNFACQKLSETEKRRSVVYSSSSITNISLTSHFHCHGSCSRTSICNSQGCTCAPGFRGNNCDEECSQRHYGYNCKETCQRCGNRKCDKLNGKCQRECLDYFVPPGCTKELKQPHVWCIKETGVRQNYNDSDFDEKTSLQFEFENVNGKWEHVSLSPEPSSSTLRWSKESIEKLKREKKYNVRAVLHNTTGPITSFNTSCWQPSKPQDMSVVLRDDVNVTLRWKYYHHFWEETKSFEVLVESLNSKLSKDPAAEHQTETRQWSPTQQVYQVGLNLSTVKNYKFLIRAIDINSKDSKAVSVWYLIPDGDSFARTVKQSGNPATEEVIFRVPQLESTTENIFNIIVKRSSTCPRFERDQNSLGPIESTDTSRTENMKKDKFYPSCALRFNETYVFMVAKNVSDQETWNSWMICLLILPIAALCWLMYYVLRRRSSGRYMRTSQSSVAYVTTTKLRPINEPDESPFNSCMSPEMQRLRNFENQVKKNAENGVLQQQFMLLPRGLVRPCNYGRLSENKSKNRYGNLIAYDDTRVMLVRDSSGICSDYINANYVQGYCKEKAYIATQGPLPETVVDFWRMIWQEEVRVICMLVDLVESRKNMCEQYWPKLGEKVEYGNIVVLTIKQSVLADYTFRTFQVTTRWGTDSQTVEHLQYTGWPEDGVPMYSHSVVEFLQKLLSVPPGQGPVVVHCSSGTGRTGAIILSDICRRYLAVEGTVDVFEQARKMYDARGNMLHNFPQYMLAHLVPTQCLMMLPTKVLCSEITQEKMDIMKADLPAHVARLADSTWMDKAMRPLEPLRPPVSENILKNRFPKLTPVGPNLVTLSRYPTYDTNSDYISAVSVDGVKMKRQFIASQLPMPSTLTDFWRLIVEKNIELVIILQQPDPEDDTCCDIIPRGTMIPVPYLKVEIKQGSSYSYGHFTKDKLLLTDTSGKLPRTRIITVLTCDNWSPKEVARPPAPEILVDLWLASEKIQRDGPTLVLCYDGITACGLYMTLSFMLERMSIEQECDVVLAVRTVRRSRPEFMCVQWQFEYLYDAAVQYVESFKIYDNFTRHAGPSQWGE